MNSISKEVRRLENEEIDRISELPDSILSKILSHLPTKYAVGASILSTRWKNISPFGVPPVKLDLDDSLLISPKEIKSNSPSISFMDFVDRLFSKTLSDVASVQNMVLKCEKRYTDAKIVSWVCAALRLNVRYLNLDFSLKDSKTLFHGLNGCTSLVVLQLCSEYKLSVPDDFTLPNLKILELCNLGFYDVDGASVNELIEGCPALEDLSLFECFTQCLEFLIIKSPLLKNLAIEDCWIGSSCELMLNAPNLEVLIYNDCVAGTYFHSEFKRLRLAHIDVGPSQEQRDMYDQDMDDDGLWYWYDVVTLVSVCSSTSYLYLAACSIDVLQHIDHTSMQLPTFENLTWLSLGCLGLHWAILARLLWNAPNLEKLTIEEGFAENEEGFANFQNSLPGPPICLELHMKRIEFWVFRGEEDEIKLIEYFLKNGKVLEKLVLYCLPFHDINILRRVLLSPRQSKSCHVELELKERLDG